MNELSKIVAKAARVLSNPVFPKDRVPSDDDIRSAVDEALRHHPTWQEVKEDFNDH